MKQTFSKPEVVIPATDRVKRTETMKIDLPNKAAFVTVDSLPVDDEAYQIRRQDTIRVQVDLPQLLVDEGFTATQITTVKKFFKAIVAKAWGEVAADIDGDPF